MKPIDDSKLMNRLITDKLIQNLFNYLSYSYPILQFCQLPYSDLCLLKLDHSSFLILSSTVQGELFRQLCCQSLCLLGVSHFTLSYPLQLTSLFDQAFLFTLDHSSGFIGNLKNLLDNLVGLRLSRSSTLHKARQIFYNTIHVCLRAMKLRGQDYIISSAATTTLQRQKVEAEVCTRKTNIYCVQLAVPPVTTVAPSRPANFIQQSGQAFYQTLPILNDNLLP